MNRRIAAALACTLLATPAAAQLGTELHPSTLDAKIAAAREMLRTHQDTSGVVGLSAAIAVDGRIVWAGGYGWADRERQVPADSAMVSRVGSISKSIAATAAMRLVQRGELDLDAPIARYLPEYPKPMGDEITTRELMSHTAGLRHYRGREFLSDVHYDDVVAPMAVFWSDSLLFEPGTAYSYSTYGYTVVSAVTSRAAGKPWTDALRDEVVRPLRLTRLQPEWKDSTIAHLASFYSTDASGAVALSPEVDLSNKWAGGGLVSTTSDLARFALGLLHGGLLEPATRAEMWSRQTPEGEPSYGLGWGVGEIEGHRVISHSGGSVGATAMLVILPDDDVVVAVLGNTDGVGHAAITRNVAMLFAE